jgi:hypothetical protein
MADKLTTSPEEAYAASLAAFSLSVNTLRYLQGKGSLDQSDVNAIVHGVLSALERNEPVAEPLVHSTRALLSAVAADPGVPLKRPS